MSPPVRQDDSRAQPAAVNRDAPPAAAPVRVQSNDTAAVWKGVLDVLRDRPALSWVSRSLQLDEVEERIAKLSPRPGANAVGGFITDRQREQLASLISQVVGRPMRVEIGKRAQPMDAPVEEDDQRGPTRSRGNDLNEAMNGPLVTQLSEHFDISIVNVREDKQQMDDIAPPDGNDLHDDELNDDEEDEDV